MWKSRRRCTVCESTSHHGGGGRSRLQGDSGGWWVQVANWGRHPLYDATRKFGIRSRYVHIGADGPRKACCLSHVLTASRHCTEYLSHSVTSEGIKAQHIQQSTSKTSAMASPSTFEQRVAKCELPLTWLKDRQGARCTMGAAAWVAERIELMRSTEYTSLRYSPASQEFDKACGQVTDNELDLTNQMRHPKQRGLQRT